MAQHSVVVRLHLRHAATSEQRCCRLLLLFFKKITRNDDCIK